MVEDTCEKTCQKGGVDVNTRNPKEDKNEEFEKNRVVNPSFLFSFMFLIPMNLVPCEVLFYM